MAEGKAEDKEAITALDAAHFDFDAQTPPALLSPKNSFGSWSKDMDSGSSVERAPTEQLLEVQDGMN